VLVRRRTDTASPPIAAEVLEARSLLSAGAAAVHQAALHAAHTAELTPNLTLHPVVTPQATVSGQKFTGPPAKSFSITQVSLTPGSIVKVHAAFTILSQNIPVSFNGSFSGKVLSSGPFLNLTKVDVVPTGGSIVERLTLAGKKIRETFIPQGTVAAVFLTAQGEFDALAVAYVSKTNPNNPPIDFGFKV
jgi:hypothetical protein